MTLMTLMMKKLSQINLTVRRTVRRTVKVKAKVRVTLSSSSRLLMRKSKYSKGMTWTPS